MAHTVVRMAMLCINPRPPSSSPRTLHTPRPAPCPTTHCHSINLSFRLRRYARIIFPCQCPCPHLLTTPRSTSRRRHRPNTTPALSIKPVPTAHQVLASSSLSTIQQTMQARSRHLMHNPPSRPSTYTSRTHLRVRRTPILILTSHHLPPHLICTLRLRPATRTRIRPLRPSILIPLTSPTPVYLPRRCPVSPRMR